MSSDIGQKFISNELNLCRSKVSIRVWERYFTPTEGKHEVIGFMS